VGLHSDLEIQRDSESESPTRAAKKGRETGRSSGAFLADPSLLSRIPV
jgi:hypothetical protein